MVWHLTFTMDRKTNTNSIFIFIFSFTFGILVSSLVFLAPLLSIFVILVGLAVIGAEKIRYRKIGKEVLFLSLALLSFGLGALRYSIKDFHEPLIPAPTGVVISEPEQRENFTRFVLRADNGEKVLISTDLYNPVQYGDRVAVKGNLQEPSIIDDGTGRPFNYGNYLSKDDIYLTMSFAEVEILSQGHGNFVKQILFKLKHSLTAKMREILPEPQSSLLAGLIVAGKTAMPRDILEEFRRAGVIHIVVLSGYNITIIADFMRTVLGSAKLSIIGVLFFVIMTGAPATVVRAAIMVLAVVLAKILRRNFSASRALLTAAFLMLLQNPKILVFDPSFQLSFLATCGLIFITPIVERYLPQAVSVKWGHRLGGASLHTIVSTTIATQMTVLPFLIYSMGNVSLVALPANILILLFIPVTMLVGFIATLLAYLSPIVALPVSYPTHLLLAWTLGVSHYLSNLSFASINIPPLSPLLVIFIYLVIIIFVWHWQNSLPRSASLG